MAAVSTTSPRLCHSRAAASRDGPSRGEVVEVDERPVEGRSSSMQLSITEDGEGGSSLFIFKMGLTGAANSEALGTPPPLPPNANVTARAHKAVHWLGAALAKMKVKSRLRAAARSVQALTHRWTIAAAGWNFVG